MQIKCWRNGQDITNTKDNPIEEIVSYLLLKQDINIDILNDNYIINNNLQFNTYETEIIPSGYNYLDFNITIWDSKNRYEELLASRYLKINYNINKMRLSDIAKFMITYPRNNEKLDFDIRPIFFQPAI